MLINIHHDSKAEHARLFVLGIVFMAVLVTLVGLCIAIYNKKFETVEMVTIKAERAGLQLAVHGDVRAHGVLVGQIREINQDGTQAEIKVALQPEAARQIDKNVGVQIIPTTLFGQKFIALTDPTEPAGRAISDGDLIPADRVETNVELSRILANLFPMLRSVDPAALNTTLYSLATALNGRGDDIGDMMESLDGYLTRFNPKLPALRRDLKLLAQVAESYDGAAEDLVRLMRNATVTAETISSKEKALGTFLDDLTGVAATSTRVLGENEQGMIRLGELSRPLLRLLDTYSPQYPCLLRGLDRYTSRLSEIFQNRRVSQILELGAVQRPTYDENDKPEYGEVGHGPWCLGLPNPQVPIGPQPLNDGSDQDELDGPPLIPPMKQSQKSVQGDRSAAPGERRRAGHVNPTSGYAGTPEEQQLVNTLMSAQTGRPASSYGSLGSLLLGPQLRGTEVSTR